MTATVAEARDAIVRTFRDAWLADPTTLGYPLAFQDVSSGEIPPKMQTPWARHTIIHSPGVGGQVAYGDSKRRYRRFGVITVQLFAPTGEGQTKTDEMLRVAMQAYEGVRDDDTGVVFRNVRFSEIGQDGDWWQVNVLADFDYDEVR